MRHLAILGSTGVVMGLLSTLVGLPLLVEFSLWIIFYVLWVVYGVRFRLEMPVRTITVGSTLAGLITGSIQVLLMEAYKENNPWHAELFDGPAQQLATQFLGQGIALGFFFGLVVGLIVRWRLKKIAAA
jgi:hypothetical protein